MKTRTKLLSIAIVFLIGTSALSILPHQAKSATSGLVGYWKFDEGSGNIASDSSGNGNDGTVNGASWTGGISNEALQFNGISNYVGISSSPSLVLSGNQVSLELWIKPTVALNSGLASRINIMDKGDGYGFQMEVGDGRISFFVNNAYGDQWLPTETSDWKAGTWYLIAGTYDGTNERVYVNGALENTKSLSGTLSGIGHPLSIGSYCYGTMNFFNGAIDEVKIYNRALTSDEIYTDYAASQQTEQTSIWMQWWFWTIIALGAIVVILAFTTVHYHKKPSVPKEANVVQSKTTQRVNRVCPKCGASLPADSKFCGKCGTSLE